MKVRRSARQLRSLDLFTGAGGFVLGLAHCARPVAYCDINPAVQRFLERRMAGGQLPRAPLFPDVKELGAAHLKGRVDLITAGFPCQDISSAGQRRGLTGARSGLVTEVLRLLRHLRPRLALFENVPPIARDGQFPQLLRDLQRCGYDVAYGFFSASSLGALHRRNRWFLLARRRHGNVDAAADGRLAARSLKHAARLAKHLRPRAPAVCDLERDCGRQPSEGTLWGNAVVPAVVSLAFGTLLRRLVDDKPGQHDGDDVDYAEPLAADAERPHNTVGYLRRGTREWRFPHDSRVFQDTRCSASGATAVAVDPKNLHHFRAGGSRGHRRLPPPQAHTRACLPTPRLGSYSGGAKTSISTRTRNDMAPTVFASDLVPAKLRRSKRFLEHYRINPAWLAQLMGFPPGWNR